ncbi:MAG: right-handed parallel beta-helix repeat-containing protein [Luteolibacter sp.]
MKPILRLLAAAVTVGLLHAQGSLTPPAGAPVPSMKTLAEIDNDVNSAASGIGSLQTTANSILAAKDPRTPINSTTTPGTAASNFRITTKGSYYLTGNITGASGKAGIEIATNDVTIDLMGFTMTGVPGSLDGIRSSFNYNIVIQNGTIRDFGGDGIDLRQANAFSFGSLIEGIIVFSNDGAGIIPNEASVVRRCIASANGGNGFSVWDYGTIEDCISTKNAGNGISCDSEVSVSRCSATANTQDGILAFTSNRISGNHCSNNGSFTGNGAGIHATSGGNVIENNHCSFADRGVDVDGTANFIVRNTCYLNTVNWDIVANNVYGPIIDRTVPASAAVSGNSAASTLATTDPNANFSY